MEDVKSQEAPQAADEPLITLRPIRPSDQNFIFSTWLKSFKNGDAVRNVPSKLYYAYQHVLVEGLLKRAYTVVLANTKNPDFIYGYLCFEAVGTAGGKALLVHYAYLKVGARHQGLMQAAIQRLLEVEQPAAVFYTHRTGSFRHFVGKHGLENADVPWVYNPFLLWGQVLPGSRPEPSATIKGLEA